MAGRDGRGPTRLDAEVPLQRRVESIKAGSIGGFTPFDGQGRPVQFS